MVNRHERRFAWVFGCIAVLILCVLVFSSVAHAVQFGSMGGRPANPDPDNPRSKSIFVHTLEPGTVIEDAITLLNFTGETKTLEVYATDAAMASGGSFGCAQKVVEPKNVGTWVEFSQTEATLPDRTTLNVPFTITVPDNPDVGENDGCIVIQEKKKTKKAEGGGISLSFRTGLRLSVLIPGDIVKRLLITDYTVTKKTGGDYNLRPQVKNEGNVSLDTTITTVTGYYFGGTIATTSNKYPIIRGATSEWNYDFKRPFWGGLLKSHFTATYDSNVNNSLGMEQNRQMVTLKSKEVIFFVPPTTGALLIILGILIFIGVLLLIFFLFMKRKRKVKETWQEITIAEHQTDINALAAEYGVSWKKLAKINKLKAPYTLKVGDKIKVPPKPTDKTQTPQTPTQTPTS